MDVISEAETAHKAQTDNNYSQSMPVVSLSSPCLQIACLDPLEIRNT